MGTDTTTTSSIDFRGVIPILPTPFFDDETIDIDALTGLVRFVAGLGVDGVTVLGVLGEAGSLSDHEATTIVRELCAAELGVPVIVGASRLGVRPAQAFIETVASLGADAVMVAPPSIHGIAEIAVWRFYEQVASKSPLSLIVQDHPASTQVTMSIELLARLVNELEAVSGIKCESVPTAPKVRAIKASTTRVPIMTGLGALYSVTDLVSGADGLNTGFAFPEVLLALRELVRAGDPQSARTVYQRFLPLIVLEQQPGPAIRKEIWRRRGLLSTARTRTPAAQLDAWMAEELGVVLDTTFGAEDLSAPITQSFVRRGAPQGPT